MAPTPPVQWRPTTRIGLWATLASAAIGILLAVFQVQGWKVPKPLALLLIVLLLAVIAGALSMIALEVSRLARRFLEHRATTPGWVAETEPGLLDYEADGIRAQERFTKELGRLSHDTESLGSTLERHASRFQSGAGWSAEKRQRRANRAAKAINKSGAFIEKRLALLEALVHDVARNADGLIGTSELETSDDLQAAKEFRDTLEDGREATIETLTSITEYRDTVRSSEQQNLSRSLRIAYGRLAAALDGVVTMMRNHESRLTQLIRALGQKIDEAEAAQ
jgi:hypothetical protein